MIIVKNICYIAVRKKVNAKFSLCLSDSCRLPISCDFLESGQCLAERCGTHYGSCWESLWRCY